MKIKQIAWKHKDNEVVEWQCMLDICYASNLVDLIWRDLTCLCKDTETSNTELNWDFVGKKRKVFVFFWNKITFTFSVEVWKILI